MAKLSRVVGGLDPAIAAARHRDRRGGQHDCQGGIVLFTGAPELKRAILPGFILITLVAE